MMEHRMDGNIVLQDWYTYTLAWHAGKVFYVGRGRNYYWDRHEQKALRGEKCRVTDVICEIWLRGETVIKQKQHENLTEEEAYRQQVLLYAKYSTINPEMVYPGSYPRPIGHGKNIGASRKAKGYQHSEESKKKMTQSRIGKKYSEDRLSRNLRRMKNPVHLNTPEVKAKMATTKTGKPRPIEVMKKLQEGRIRALEAMTEEEKAKRLRPWIEAGQKASKRITKDTTLEKIIEESLKSDGVEYTKQHQVSYYQCDFYIPSTNTIIEVNGCFAHRCPVCGWNEHNAEEIRAKDKRKIDYLLSKGYTVKVIWEHAIEGHKVRLPKKRKE